MAVTYNNLVDSIKFFADNHPQINDFGYGDHTRIGSKQHKYPFLFVHPLPSRLKTNSVELSFNILAMDLMNPDLSNEQEIHNDMLLVINDLKTWLNGNSVEWSVEEGDIDSFSERFGDYVAGQNFKLTVIMEMDFGCNVPGLSFNYDSTNNCPECPETVANCYQGNLFDSENVSGLGGGPNFWTDASDASNYIYEHTESFSSAVPLVIEFDSLDIGEYYLLEFGIEISGVLPGGGLNLEVFGTYWDFPNISDDSSPQSNTQSKTFKQIYFATALSNEIYFYPNNIDCRIINPSLRKVNSFQ
jgi:hypothetical protein